MFVLFFFLHFYHDNDIIDFILIVGAGNPTYLKEPADKAFVGAAFGGMFVGLSVIIYGLYGMTYGINKVPGH